MSSANPKGQKSQPKEGYTVLARVLIWLFTIILDLFFREIKPRSSWKIPRKGPLIFVAAPHANQFVDSVILIEIILKEAKRSVSFLTAEKSMRRKFIGTCAKQCGAIGVGRALDSTKSVPGRIYLPEPIKDPCLIRGIGTDFESSDFQIGGLLVIKKSVRTSVTAVIDYICGPHEVRIKKPFESDVISLLTVPASASFDQTSDKTPLLQSHDVNNSSDTLGVEFKVAPKVDQTQLYAAVCQKLNEGGCVGIFPEGGSHDRTELLPLKAGVAIMALDALSKNQNNNLKIIPCGMNYFNAHKFRSRAVVEFGTPIEVPGELVEMYKSGDKREAVGKLLDIIYQALVAVTVTCPDYETLMLIQAVRRLYNHQSKRLPLTLIVELNRRLVKGYNKYKNDPRIIHLRKSVLSYNKQLNQLNLRDHQVEYAKLSKLDVVITLITRVVELIVLSAAVLPGLILFSPVLVASKAISIKKSREALASSSVKVQGLDVIATWKLLVAIALVPALYIFLLSLLAWWTMKNRIQGFVPESMTVLNVVCYGVIGIPALMYAALRFGEVGMDILKSIRPLVIALSPTSGNVLSKLRARRKALATDVTNVINELGPELFVDFETARINFSPLPSRYPNNQ